MRRIARNRQAAAYIGKSESWLEKSRLTGQGPPYEKIGGTVTYDLDEVDAWLKQHKRRSTSEAAA